MELGETMADNLVAKGVSASASDGLTTLAGKILDIQTGGSCYHIEFSEASYKAFGGSATLEVYLQENYAPKSGASVTVTGSDGSVYNGITNTNGLASITVSVSSETTFTCTYNNVSDACTVIIPVSLFYDACNSADGLVNYGNSEVVRGTNAAITMTYDSTENAYKVSGSGNYHAFKPITALKDKDQYILSVDVKGQAIRYNLIGLYLDNYSNTSSYGLAFGLDIGKVDGSHQTLYGCLYRVSSDGSRYPTNVTGNPLVATKYYTLTFTVNGNTLTGALYDGTTKLAEKTVTYTINNKSMGIFLYCETGSTNSACYIKNIKAEAL